MIKELLEKYGKIKKIKKWDFLYKNNENDQNLYFIKKWEVLLTINWKDIAIVWEWELSWEKSFINKTPKPIDAKALTEVEVLFISPEDFENFNSEIKENLLKQITLFISDRVYLLNDIINNISLINKNLISTNPKLSIEYIQNIFWDLIKIEEIYIYKTIEGAILPIFESKLNPDIQEEIQKITNKQKVFSQKNWYTTLKINEFTLVGKFTEQKNKYISNNVLIHSLSSIKYLCEKLDNLKNQELNNLLE